MGIQRERVLDPLSGTRRRRPGRPTRLMVRKRGASSLLLSGALSPERGELKAFVPSVPALPRIAAPAPCLNARYPATPLSVRVIRGEVEEVARGCGLAGEALGDVLLAVSEAATNAVVHGSVGREDAQVEVVVELTDLEMLVTVSDSGNGLRPN